MYLKYRTPKKPHQKEPSPAANKPLLNSLFIINLRAKINEFIRLFCC